MYAGRGFEVSELGDVDVFLNEGYYHLFHLVLPNHDYIAHAVSHDGFLWRRVRNALFIGEPGDWDDDMLWTMHVSKDPEWPSSFRMFYTGISRKEAGKIQRIGMARSSDLYHWEKVSSANYPLSITGPHYESGVNEGRHWVSCRDPFFYHEEDVRLLLVNARVSTGPVVRRGCIGMAREVEPDTFIWERPLFLPRMYDDIEVPGLHKIENRYYLVGNIKEDIKIHYWHADTMFGQYESYSSNVLLPKGNYAARIIRVDDRYLLWNFFTNHQAELQTTILPPPTELKTEENGELYLTSYWRFDEKVKKNLSGDQLFPMRQIFGNSTADTAQGNDGVILESRSGYEIFYVKPMATDFRLRYSIYLEGLGKTGIVFRADEEANGHYLSLDLIHGFAQGRIWGERLNGGIENAFFYQTIQNNKFEPKKREYRQIEIIAFGGYIELSINGKIILRYVETSYMEQTALGFYVESAKIDITNLSLDILDGPVEEDHQVL
jgi:beta-fructofuranosidase